VTDPDCLRTCVPSRNDLAILPPQLPSMQTGAEAVK
jgi:hypothetical protein